MRTLVAFLLGLIIGGAAVLFLPDPRRNELNAEVRTQTDALQAELHQFGDQLKTLSLPKPGNSSPSPSHQQPEPSERYCVPKPGCPSASPTAQDASFLSVNGRGSRRPGGIASSRSVVREAQDRPDPALSLLHDRYLSAAREDARPPQICNPARIRRD